MIRIVKGMSKKELEQIKLEIKNRVDEADRITKLMEEEGDDIHKAHWLGAKQGLYAALNIIQQIEWEVFEQK